MKFLERALDGQNQFWKYVIIFLIAFLGGQMLGGIPLFAVIAIKSLTIEGGVVLNPENLMDFSVYGISKNLGLFLIILPFVVTLILAIVLIKALHKRTFAETVNGTRKIRFGRIGAGAAVWTILLVVYFIVDYSLAPANYVLQLDWAKLAVLAILSLCLIPLQTTAEEVLFRGYLAQGVAAWTKNRWLALIIPSVIFGLIHFANPEIKEYGFWLAMPQYIFFGLLWGLISILDDGIELAIGMHAANNVFLSIFVTHSSSALQTDALFEMQTVAPVRDLAMLVVVGTLSLVYFAYRYKWNFGILNQKIVTE